MYKPVEFNEWRAIKRTTPWILAIVFFMAHHFSSRCCEELYGATKVQEQTKLCGLTDFDRMEMRFRGMQVPSECQ